MRGRWALGAALALRASVALAADGRGPTSEAAVPRAAIGAWPGFQVRMTPELAALAPPVAAADALVITGPTRAEGVAAPTCTASATMPRMLAPSTARARDGLIAVVRAAECRHGLPTGLLDSLVLAESAYRARALSRAGALGLTQLMPATAREVGVTDRTDTDRSIEGGATYLRRMIDRFGEVRLALAAYNAGPNAVLRAGGVPANGETPGYVARVVGLWRAVAEEEGHPHQRVAGAGCRVTTACWAAFPG